MTADRLERAAYHYLERYATSTNGFRRVLERKIRRTNTDFSADLSSEQQAWIDALVEKCTRLKFLDDQLYATAKARSLARHGKPVRTIRQWLAARGVKSTEIDHAINALANEQGGVKALDMAAACRFAQRRRFGPWRRDDRGYAEPDASEQSRAKHDKRKKDREIAAFSRAGFSWHQTMAVLDAGSIEDALALAETEDSYIDDGDIGA